jgi:hypothetical protein
MYSDSINDQIRDIRRNLSAQFGNDLDLILADVRRRETSDSRNYVSLPPRTCSRKADEQSDAPKSPVGREFES